MTKLTTLRLADFILICKHCAVVTHVNGERLCGEAVLLFPVYGNAWYMELTGEVAWRRKLKCNYTAEVLEWYIISKYSHCALSSVNS